MANVLELPTENPFQGGSSNQVLELPQVPAAVQLIDGQPAMAAQTAVPIPQHSPNLGGFAAETVSLLEGVLPALAGLIMSFINNRGAARTTPPASLVSNARRAAPRPTPLPSQPALSNPDVGNYVAPSSNGAPAGSNAGVYSTQGVDPIAAGVAAASGCSSKADCGTRFLDGCLAVARANGIDPSECLDFADQSYGVGSRRTRARFNSQYQRTLATPVSCPTGFSIDPLTGSCVLSS